MGALSLQYLYFSLCLQTFWTTRASTTQIWPCGNASTSQMLQICDVFEQPTLWTWTLRASLPCRMRLSVAPSRRPHIPNTSWTSRSGIVPFAERSVAISGASHGTYSSTPNVTPARLSTIENPAASMATPSVRHNSGKLQAVSQQSRSVEGLYILSASRRLDNVGNSSDPVTVTATIDCPCSTVHLIKPIQIPPGGPARPPGPEHTVNQRWPPNRPLRPGGQSQWDKSPSRHASLAV